MRVIHYYIDPFVTEPTDGEGFDAEIMLDIDGQLEHKAVGHFPTEAEAQKAATEAVETLHTKIRHTITGALSALKDVED